jgi:preprotein translocase subunit SecG
MELILLIVHLIIALVLIGVVLMQRSEGGGLGIGGGGGGGGGAGGMSGFMTGRGTANFLTRTTAILAACFMGTSIALAILAGSPSERGSILDVPAEEAVPEPLEQPAPLEPAEPSVPLQ